MSTSVLISVSEPPNSISPDRMRINTLLANEKCIILLSMAGGINGYVNAPRGLLRCSLRV